MNPPWTVRPLVPADLPAYRAIRLDSLRLHPRAYGSSYEEEAAYTLDDFAARWPAPPGVALGGFVAGRLAGIAGLLVPARPKQRHKGFIYGIYVQQEARGHGLARGLVKTAIAAARAAGLVYVWLNVSVGNDPARRLYDGLGFRAVGLEPRALRVDGVYVHEETMVLDLDGTEAT
jgi:ribosomal protein S18 acetylase RimI-like enzyme